ncbi:MAG TPA: hypothetical protein VF883_24260 [Thermoanaerobaculia bacterium]
MRRSLHRLINVALREREIPLLVHDDAAELDVKKKWRDLVQDGDRAINVEGSTFLPNGHLLLALRYPVTAHAIRSSSRSSASTASSRERSRRSPRSGSWRTSAARKRRPASAMLDARGSSIHLVTGNIDDPKLRRPPSGHHEIVAHSQRPVAVRRVAAERIRAFRGNAHVEGIAVQTTARSGTPTRTSRSV